MNDHPDIEKLLIDADGISVREIIRQLFRNPANGTPDNISKAGCFALALKSNEAGGAGKGHVVWNAWREIFPAVRNTKQWRNHVDFSNADWTGKRLRLSNFKFGHGAKFEHSEWGDRFNFEAAQWGDDCDFEQTNWGSHANFSRAVWGDGADFESAKWGSYANFSHATWGEGALFEGAKWGTESIFRAARWGDRADFNAANWAGNSYFVGATWGNYCLFRIARWESANFTGAVWGNENIFEGAQWGRNNVFRRAKWGSGINLKGTQFGGIADFQTSSWGACIDFSGSDWNYLKNRYQRYQSKEIYEQAKSWANDRGMGPDYFPAINFSGARFAGHVIFSGRRFSATTNFGFFHSVAGEKTKELSADGKLQRIKRDNNKNAIFNGEEPEWEPDPDQRLHVVFGAAPIFHGCEFNQDTSFEGAVFPEPSGSEEAARAYRTLKLTFSKQQAIREEQRFFKLEMEEETLREKGLKRWLFKSYKTFSDYGFSIERPLKYGGSSVLGLTAIYGLISWLGQCGLQVQACRFAPEWLEFSLLQTLPLPGLDKLREAASKVFWPIGAWWGLCLSVLVILHKTLSIVTLFLVGVALRNLFKLK